MYFKCNIKALGILDSLYPSPDNYVITIIYRYGKEVRERDGIVVAWVRHTLSIAMTPASSLLQSSTQVVSLDPMPP